MEHDEGGRTARKLDWCSSRSYVVETYFLRLVGHQETIPRAGQVHDPQGVDLLGRQVLQVGTRFALLPMRHVPIEEPYDPRYGWLNTANRTSAKDQ